MSLSRDGCTNETVDDVLAILHITRNVLVDLDDPVGKLVYPPLLALPLLHYCLLHLHRQPLAGPGELSLLHDHLSRRGS